MGFMVVFLIGLLSAVPGTPHDFVSEDVSRYGRVSLEHFPKDVSTVTDVNPKDSSILFDGIFRFDSFVLENLPKTKKYYDENLPDHDECVLKILECDNFEKLLMIPLKGSDYRETASDLKEKCRQQAKYTNCMIKAEEFCKDMPQRLPIGDVMIENRRISGKLCVLNSQLQKVLLENAPCFSNSLFDVVKECSYIRENVEFQENYAAEFCRRTAESLECFVEGVKSRCGNGASELFRKLFVFRAGTDHFCSVFSGLNTAIRRVTSENFLSFFKTAFLNTLKEIVCFLKEKCKEINSRRLKKELKSPTHSPNAGSEEQNESVTVTESKKLIDPLSSEIINSELTTALDNEIEESDTEVSLRVDVFPEERFLSSSDYVDLYLPKGYKREIPSISTARREFDTGKTISDRETSLKNTFPKATYTDEKDITVLDGYVHEMPSKLITVSTSDTGEAFYAGETSMSNNAFPETTSPDAMDITVTDAYVHEIPPRLTTVSTSDTVEDFSTGETSLNTEITTLPSNIVAIRSILTKSYMHKNITTFGLYEVLREQQDTLYVGCGKGIALWTTDSPSKNEFCAWLNVETSEKLFRCSIRIDEPCILQATSWENPLDFSSRQVMLGVYEPDQDNQVKEVAMIEVVYFKPQSIKAEATNSYVADVTKLDSCEREIIQSGLTNVRMFDVGRTTSTTEPSVSKDAFLETQTSHSNPGAVDPTPSDGYAHENVTTFGLYKVVGARENYLGCGKAKTLWSTNRPFKNAFCAWLNVEASEMLFRCLIRVDEPCFLKSISWRNLPDFPTRQVMLGVYEPDQNNRVIEMATMKVAYFIPRPPEPSTLRMKDKLHSGQRDPCDDADQSEMLHRVGNMTSDDGLFDMEGDYDAESSGDNDEYFVEESYFKHFEDEYEYDDESDEDENVTSEDTFAGHETDGMIYIEDDTGDFISLYHPRSPLFSHALYNPYALYRPRMGEMIDDDASVSSLNYDHSETKEGTIKGGDKGTIQNPGASKLLAERSISPIVSANNEYCSAEGHCPLGSKASSTFHVKPYAGNTGTVDQGKPVELKPFEESQWETNLNYIHVGDSYSSTTESEDDSEIQPNESTEIYGDSETQPNEPIETYAISSSAEFVSPTTRWYNDYQNEYLKLVDYEDEVVIETPVESSYIMDPGPSFGYTASSVIENPYEVYHVSKSTKVINYKNEESEGDASFQFENPRKKEKLINSAKKLGLEELIQIKKAHDHLMEGLKKVIDFENETDYSQFSF